MTTSAAKSVGKKVLGALVLGATFLGALTMLARAEAEGSTLAPASEVLAAPRAEGVVAPMGALPARVVGELPQGDRERPMDVAALTAAIVAEGDAPGTDPPIGRPPHATRLFSGRLDADGTRMFVYETTASLKETNAWADERASKLGLSAVALSEAELPKEGALEADVPREGRDPKEAAKRKLYGGREGRLVLSVKDAGDKRVVTLVALGNEKLTGKAAPRPVDGPEAR